MSKLSIAEALKLVDVSKTTLYRDLKQNKLSSTTDAKGKKVIDTAELERFYGQLKSPPVNGAGNNRKSQSDPTEQKVTHGTPASDTSAHNATVDTHTAVIAVMEDQVALLKSQLERECQEKAKLLEMLAMEQEKTKLLMLPQPEAQTGEKKGRWLGFFRRKP